LKRFQEKNNQKQLNNNRFEWFEDCSENVRNSSNNNEQNESFIGVGDRHSWIAVLAACLSMFENESDARRAVEAFGGTCKSARDLLQTTHCVAELSAVSRGNLMVTLDFDSLDQHFYFSRLNRQPLAFCRALATRGFAVTKLIVRFDEASHTLHERTQARAEMYDAILHECLRLCPRTSLLRTTSLPGEPLLAKLDVWRPALQRIAVVDTSNIITVLRPATHLEQFMAKRQINVVKCSTCTKFYGSRCDVCDAPTRCDRCFDCTLWPATSIKTRKHCDARRCFYRPLCDTHASNDRLRHCQCDACKCSDEHAMHHRCARPAGLVNCQQCHDVVCQRSAFIGDCSAMFLPARNRRAVSRVPIRRQKKQPQFHHQVPLHHQSVPAQPQPQQPQQYNQQQSILLQQHQYHQSNQSTQAIYYNQHNNLFASESGECFICARCVTGNSELLMSRCAGGCRTTQCPVYWHSCASLPADFVEFFQVDDDDDDNDDDDSSETQPSTALDTPFWVECGRGTACVASIDMLPLRRGFTSSQHSLVPRAPRRDELVRKPARFCTETPHIFTCRNRACVSERGYVCVHCVRAADQVLCEACGDVLELSHGIRRQKTRGPIKWVRRRWQAPAQCFCCLSHNKIKSKF